MRLKALGFAAAVAIAGVTSLAETLNAQEDMGPESRVRVLAFGQGSYLGVFIADVTAEDVDRLGLGEERGVRITGVADEGPARDAGLQEDDVIVSWNGDRIESEAQLRRILGETPAGRSASVGVLRGGSETSIAVKLGHRGDPGGEFTLRSGWDEESAIHLREQLERTREHLGDMNVRIREMPHVMAFMSTRGGRLGVGIQSLEPQLAEYFGLGERTGVLITTVKEDSPAAEAGLKAGDVILSVGGEGIESTSDVSRLVWGAEGGAVAIRILRDRDERTLTVDLPEAENTWQSDDGEMNGFFFDSDEFDMEFDANDAHVEWVEPVRELSRFKVLGEPGGPVTWVPARSAWPTRRALSI
ncbi:MAG: PDZ domain-containing protein [Gemmatimonadetes bacterium]|nr:PDZ domain-containing protein [Gemmatimonadota bacterium]